MIIFVLALCFNTLNVSAMQNAQALPRIRCTEAQLEALKNGEDGGKRTEKRCPDNVAYDLLQHLQMPMDADLKKQPVQVLLLDARGGATAPESIYGTCKGIVSRNINEPEFKFYLNWPDRGTPELLHVHEEATATWYHVENAEDTTYAATYVVKLGAGAFTKRALKSPRPVPPSMSPGASPSPKSVPRSMPKSASKKRTRLDLNRAANVTPFASPPLFTPSAFALGPQPTLPKPPPILPPIAPIEPLAAPNLPDEAWICSNLLKQEAFIDGIWSCMKETNTTVHELLGEVFLNKGA